MEAQTGSILRLPCRFWDSCELLILKPEAHENPNTKPFKPTHPKPETLNPYTLNPKPTPSIEVELESQGTQDLRG